MADLFCEVKIAEAIATIAHRNQTDKAGNPYIDHPRRVAASFNGHEGCLRYQAVAWLHDVLEDTDITRDDLHDAGISWPVIIDVELLTRSKDVSPEDYYAKITASQYALAVKLADIDDNTDPSRLALLDDATIVRLTRKYAKARLLLAS